MHTQLFLNICIYIMKCKIDVRAVYSTRGKKFACNIFAALNNRVRLINRALMHKMNYIYVYNCMYMVHICIKHVFVCKGMRMVIVVYSQSVFNFLNHSLYTYSFKSKIIRKIDRCKKMNNNV